MEPSWKAPPVTAPLRVLSGDPVTTEGFCFLFGDTTELSTETLINMYGSLDSYVQELETAAVESVSKGWLLQIDADIMVEEETQRAVSLGLTNQISFERLTCAIHIREYQWSERPRTGRRFFRSCYHCQRRCFS